jgi:hypothetical protein
MPAGQLVSEEGERRGTYIDVFASATPGNWTSGDVNRERKGSEGTAELSGSIAWRVDTSKKKAYIHVLRLLASDPEVFNCRCV